ncbi:hypothetical protein [Streptomyces sp. GbtcB6]|uniref:hypothetical protein n=1 Tax=Streptomyces sp. GbtcB6 TaxID=2824751 RepID=UPI001C30669A|nr:hypothetical protein [Streptomyces sp. GbtcB6]
MIVSFVAFPVEVRSTTASMSDGKAKAGAFLSAGAEFETVGEADPPALVPALLSPLSELPSPTVDPP